MTHNVIGRPRAKGVLNRQISQFFNLGLRAPTHQKNLNSTDFECDAAV